MSGGKISKRRCSAKKATKKPPAEEAEDSESAEPEEIKVLDRRVFFYSEVTASSVLCLLEHLETAAQWALQHCVYGKDARVYLYIHSGGGDVYAGLSAMDHIRACRVPVITVADGYVASAATFMLLGGYKRYGMPSTNILIHQLSAEFWGTSAELEYEIVNTRKLMRGIREMYAKHTKLSGHQLDNMLKCELLLNCDESIKYGFVSRRMTAD